MSVSGLASGLDTTSIIAQLMSAERVPRTRLELRQAAAQTRQDALRDINAKLRALETVASDLRSPLLWTDTQTVSVADPTKLDAKRTGNVAAGGYSIQVTQLAGASQKSFTWTAPAKESRVTIEGVQVAIPAGTSLQDAIKLINAAGTGVIVEELGGRLLLTAKATGASSTVDVLSEEREDGSGTWVAGGPLSGETVLRAGQDATISIDGQSAVSDPDGTFESAVPGLAITAKALGTTAVNVSALAPDPAAAEAKLKAFVDAYNAAIEAVRSRVTEKDVANPRTTIDARKGTLFNDSTLNSILSRLRRTVGETLGPNPQLGVSTAAATGTASSPDALAGKLSFDAAKLREALAKDFAGTKSLVQTTVGASFEAVLEPLANVGGLLDERIASSDRELGRLKSSMARMDDRLERKEAAYRAQFTRLERMLAENQARQVDLMSSLAGLQ
jgi:flagellar hook-associated protein 2